MGTRLLRNADAGSEHAEAGGNVAPGKSTLTARLMRSRAVQRDREATAANDAGDLAPDAEATVARAASSSGAGLPPRLQQTFEQSLGADLSAVRLHTGGDSARAAQAVGAQAYAVGNDIHFAAGRYQPDDPFGMHLLAHEVAHTVQQQGSAAGPAFKLEVSEPGDAHEVEADRAADAMVAGAPAQVSTWSGLARKISRKVDLEIARIRFKKEFLPRFGGDKAKAKEAYMKELGGPANWDDAIIEEAAPPPPPAVSGPSTPQPSAEEVDEIVKGGADQGGMVSKEVPAEGDSPVLPVGTYVHKLGNGATDGSIAVYAFSGINRKRDMSSDSFRPQPGLRYEVKDGHNKMDEATYQESASPLWSQAGPQPEDALSQGGSGDCYFLSALASVCARNPAAIKDAISPTTKAPTHTVRYFKKPKDSDGLSPVYFTVDSFLPTAKDGTLQYAKGGNGGIWAPLMEKAWGLYTGSYDSNGGGCSDHSNASSALAAITGNESEKAERGDGVIERIRALDDEHKAVTVGIKADPDEKAASEPGGPARGATYQEYNLFGAHQYMFAGMAGDAIELKNPWGKDDPTKPLPEPVIDEVVNDISTAAVPGAGSPAYEEANRACQEQTGSDAVECSTGGGGGPGAG